MNNPVQNKNKTKAVFSALFEENRSRIEKRSAAVLNALRDEASEVFSVLGIPSSKNEDYKYTDMQPLFGGEFDYNLYPPAQTGKLEPDFTCEVDALDTHTVFLVNGWYYPGNHLEGLPKGVRVGSLSQIAEEDPDFVARYYGKQAPWLSDGMVALNTMFAQDGFVVHVPAGIVLEKPIQIVNIFLSENAMMTHQRNLVVLEENSEARILICDHTISQHRYAANSVTEVFVGREARLDLYDIQNQHNATTRVAGFYLVQGEKSSVQTCNLTLHTGVGRNNIQLKLAGEKAEGYVYGLYLLDKNQHVDNHSYIDHAVPDCFSDELFKGVLDDHATGAFSGKIMVRPDAQHTNAFQKNNNLLLTRDARINTKPQLEIYADDVKCSHGATVGQLDEDALFYLRTRGINQEEANVLLMYAFAYEVIDKIKVKPLQMQIQSLVEKRFRGELDKCSSCVVCEQKGIDLAAL